VLVLAHMFYINLGFLITYNWILPYYVTKERALQITKNVYHLHFWNLTYRSIFKHRKIYNIDD